MTLQVISKGLVNIQRTLQLFCKKHELKNANFDQYSASACSAANEQTGNFSCYITVLELCMSTMIA